MKMSVYPGCWSNNFNDTLCSETAAPIYTVMIKCAKTGVTIQKGLWESQSMLCILKIAQIIFILIP